MGQGPGYSGTCVSGDRKVVMKIGNLYNVKEDTTVPITIYDGSACMKIWGVLNGRNKWLGSHLISGPMILVKLLEIPSDRINKRGNPKSSIKAVMMHPDQGLYVVDISPFRDGRIVEYAAP